MKRAPQQQGDVEMADDDVDADVASVDSMDIDSDLEDGGVTRKKTKAEIMSEIISKSKHFRVRT